MKIPLENKKTFSKNDILKQFYTIWKITKKIIKYTKNTDEQPIAHYENV